MTEENSNSKDYSSELLLPSIAWYAVKTLISPPETNKFRRANPFIVQLNKM